MQLIVIDIKRNEGDLGIHKGTSVFLSNAILQNSIVNATVNTKWLSLVTNS